VGNATIHREVSLSFGGHPRVEKGLFDGTVTATLRSRRLLEPGDWIRARTLGLLLRVDFVEVLPVCDAATLYHKEMGFPTAKAFLSEWRGNHPHRPSLSRVAYLYRFHRVRPWNEGTAA